MLTEDELRKTPLFKSKKLPAPKLALNCICGQNALEVLRHLAHGGIMVTYGGMSREPLTVPTSALIFKVITLASDLNTIVIITKTLIHTVHFQDISMKGFWMTAWTKTNMASEERVDMFNDLAGLFRDGKLQSPPHKLVPFCEYQEAIANALKIDGRTDVKYILDLTKS